MKNTTTETTAKDPVCGMDIETAPAALRTKHAGETYYFCGSKCKDQFDLDPNKYLHESAGMPKSGHSCCG